MPGGDWPLLRLATRLVGQVGGSGAGSASSSGWLEAGERLGGNGASLVPAAVADANLSPTFASPCRSVQGLAEPDTQKPASSMAAAADVILIEDQTRDSQSSRCAVFMV